MGFTIDEAEDDTVAKDDAPLTALTLQASFGFEQQPRVGAGRRARQAKPNKAEAKTKAKAKAKEARPSRSFQKKVDKDIPAVSASVLDERFQETRKISGQCILHNIIITSCLLQHVSCWQLHRQTSSLHSSANRRWKDLPGALRRCWSSGSCCTGSRQVLAL